MFQPLVADYRMSRVGCILLLSCAVLLGNRLSYGWTCAAPTPRDESLPDSAIARCGTLRLRHGEAVESLCYSRDGKLLISGGADRIIRLWDVPSGKLVARHPAVSASSAELGIRGVSCTPDGKRVAYCDSEGVWLWDWSDRRKPILLSKPLRRNVDQNSVFQPNIESRRVLFSPTGQFLLCSDIDGNVRVWSLATNNLYLHIASASPSDLLKRKLIGASFSPDGKYLAVSRPDCSIRVWDIGEKRERVRLIGHPQGLESVVFSPTGDMIASGGVDGSIRFWSVRSGKEVSRIQGHQSGCTCLVYSKDGATIISGDGEGVVRLWDTSSGKVLRRFQGPVSGIIDLSVSESNRQLAAVGGGSVAIWRWDYDSGNQIDPINGHTSGLNSLSMFPDGKSLVTGSDDQTARLWGSSSGKSLRTPMLHPKKVWSVSCSPDGRTIATGAGDGKIRLWVSGQTNPTSVWAAHPKSVDNVCFSSDGSMVISSGSDGAVVVWDAATNNLRHKFHHDEGVIAIASSPAGGQFAISLSNQVRLADYNNGKELVRLSNNLSSIRAIAYSQNGRTLAVADSRAISVYEVAPANQSSRFVHRIQPRATVTSICFIDRGRLIVGSTDLGEIMCWHAISGKLVHKYNRGHCGITALVGSPVGPSFASANTDTTAIVWRIPTTLYAPIERNADSPHDNRQLWTLLASEDASQAHRAISSLAAMPAPTVQFLEGVLRPSESVHRDTIRQYLADLSSEQYSTRSTAYRQLVSIGDLAVPEIRKMLAGNPSADQKKQLDRLYSLATTYSIDELRTHRAIEVLEFIGNKEAIRLLKRIATGDSRTRITHSARAALLRLGE